MPNTGVPSTSSRTLSLPRVLVTSDEINILVYAYLCESRFEHAAYNLRNEARLDSSPLLSSTYPSSNGITNGITNGSSKGKSPLDRSFNAGAGGGSTKRRDSHQLLDGQGDGHVKEGQSDIAGLVPRGKLVTMLQSGLMFDEVKTHTGPSGNIHECTAPFRLLTPHSCSTEPPSSPPITFSALEDYNPLDPPSPRRPDIIPASTTDRSKPVKRKRTKGPESLPTLSRGQTRSPVTARITSGDSGAVGTPMKPDEDEDVEMEDVGSVVDKDTTTKASETASETEQVVKSKRKGGKELDGGSRSGTVTPKARSVKGGEGESTKSVGKSKMEILRDDDGDTKSTSRKEGSEASSRKRKMSQGEIQEPKITKPEQNEPSPLPTTNGESSTSKSAPKKKGRRASDASRSRASSSNAQSPVKVVAGETGDDDALLPDAYEDGVVHWRANHVKSVLHLAWNPQAANRLASCAADNTCLIWEFEPTKPEDEDQNLSVLTNPPLPLVHRSIEGRKAVNDLAWNPQGNLVATISNDCIARTFLDVGDMYAILARHARPIHCLAFNPQGNYLATSSSDGTVNVWRAAQSQAPLEVAINFHNDDAFFVDWADNEIFATCSGDSTIAICTVKSSIPNKVLRGHSDRVLMCKFSPLPPPAASATDAEPKRYLASASDDKTIRIWDIFDEKLAGPSDGRARTPAAPSVSKNLNSPAVTSSGRTKQAVSEDGRAGDYFGERVKVEPYLVKKLEGHEDDVTHVAWCPKGLQTDGRRLLVSACHADKDSRSEHGEVIKMWDVESGTCIYTITAHQDMINAVEFSAKGEMFASCSDDGLLVIWNSETGKELKRYKADAGMNDVKWRIDGLQLAMAMHDGSMRTLYVGDLFGLIGST